MIYSIVFRVPQQSEEVIESCDKQEDRTSRRDAGGKN